jgi:cytidine deaminase
MGTKITSKVVKAKVNWDQLSIKAWETRNNAFIFGNTKVGVALLDSNNNIFTGCNIEQIYRSHDIHAEVSAISKMVSTGSTKIIALLVVAERKFFTPCGSCMDWIIQFGGKDVIIGFQNNPNDKITKFTSKELMPFYPK